MWFKRLEDEITEEQCAAIQEEEQGLCEQCPCFIPFIMFMMEQEKRWQK